MTPQISHNQKSCPIISLNYLISEGLKPKPGTVMRCSLLSVTHPPLHMVKLQEPILQLICLTRVIHFALSTFPSRVWVPCPCKLSQLVSQTSSILFPVNVRIPSALISIKRAEPHHDQLPTLPSLRAKDEI